METKPETMKEQIKTPKAFVERQTEMQEESTLGIQHLLESIHIHAKYLSILFKRSGKPERFYILPKLLLLLS